MTVIDLLSNRRRSKYNPVINTSRQITCKSKNAVEISEATTSANHSRASNIINAVHDSFNRTDKRCSVLICSHSNVSTVRACPGQLLWEGSVEDTRVPAEELESASLLFVERSMGRLPSAGGSSSAASWEGVSFTCVTRTRHKRPTSATNHVTCQCSESQLTCASCSFWSSELKSSVRSASASESLLTPHRKVGGSCRRRALCSSAAVGFFSHTSVHSESETHQPHAHSQR